MIEAVRRFASELLRGAGNRHDADLAAVALATLNGTAGRLGLLERALRCYADPTFWDHEMPEASLALHDQGEIARFELAGRENFAQHRD